VIHLTLNTGHVRESPRSEVGDDIVAALLPLVRAGGGPLPQPPGYSVSFSRDGRNAIYTISASVDLGQVAQPAPLVTCGLAVERPERVWSLIGALAFMRAGLGGDHYGPARPATVPWLAVLIHEPAVLAAEAMSWLGDAERCIAWTIIEEDRHVQ